MALFTRHPLALQTAFSDLKRRAQEQPVLLVGTPGSVDVRQVRGRPFYYRQYYDAEGKKAAEYIGAVGTERAEGRAAALRDAIALTQALVKEGRLLAQSGYVRADPRSAAILGAAANHGLFRGGALVVGSHAYGALLNELGVRKTLDRKAPVTSYKAPGRDRLRVDLIVPASGSEVTVRAVPELRAHAQAVPYLQPLLAGPVDSVVIGRDGVVPIRVPRAEALAWHKVLLSETRGASSDKRGKDRAQAAVLLAVLAEDAPDALAAALSELPRGMKGKTRDAARQIVELVRSAGHEKAAGVVGEMVR